MEKRTFFKGCYVELARVQSTQNKTDFDKLAVKAIPYITAYANWMKMRYPIAVVDADDYVQEGLMAMWNFLCKYRYICPECEERFMLSQAFTKHCKTEHGRVMKPQHGLEPYLNFRIKRYMRNLMLRHVKASTRSSAMTVYIEQYEFDFPDDAVLQDKVVDTNQRIDALKGVLSLEANAKIAFFVGACLMGAEGGDIYNGMVEKGLLGSPGSARVAVSNLKRRGEFERYRQALTG